MQYSLAVVALFPILLSVTGRNPVALRSVEMLQGYNMAANTNTTEDCEFLESAVRSWALASSTVSTSYPVYDSPVEETFLLYARLTPIRCDFLEPDGVVTICPPNATQSVCSVWKDIIPEEIELATPSYFADTTGLRRGGISEFLASNQGVSTSFGVNHFEVYAIFNETHTVAYA